MSDALMDMYSDAAYDDVLKEASVDTRVGDHTFLITKREEGVWPNSGEGFIKYRGMLTTARNAKTDLTWTPPPPPEVVAAQKATWEPGRLRGVANNISLARQAAQHYGKKITDFREGDVIRVKTTKEGANKQTGDSGFIRVRAILPPAGENGGGSTPSNVGF